MSFSKFYRQNHLKTFWRLGAGEYKLSREPKGYEKDNPAIEYLKLKSLVATKALADKDLVGKDLLTSIVNGYRALMPLLQFINRSLELKFMKNPKTNAQQTLLLFRKCVGCCTPYSGRQGNHLWSHCTYLGTNSSARMVGWAMNASFAIHPQYRLNGWLTATVCLQAKHILPLPL